MIKSFRCRDTQALFEGQHPRRFLAIETQAQRKLIMLDSAMDIRDLKNPPDNHLEKLSGDRGGQWNSRINDQWRICFAWQNSDSHHVEIVDYHYSRSFAMTRNGMRPIHPGEILREEFLNPLGMTAHALAVLLKVPATRINDIVRERRTISPDTALRLARYFDTTPEFWLALQSAYDLRVAEQESGEMVNKEVAPRHVA